MNPTTQDFLEIKDVREGVVTLRNGQLRGVLMVSSINFALKAVEEQEAIVGAFQSFLNSLDFSCQIVIQSRNINITPYLDMIRNLESRQTNELMKIQTSSYSEFIKDLVKGENIMTKNFYVVVPFNLVEALGVSGALKPGGGLFGAKGGGNQMSDQDFEKCKKQLWQRMEFTAMGLKRCGLEVVALNSAELIELFWSSHHPSEAEVGYSPEILPELLK